MTAFKILASGLMLVAASGCTNFYEVPLETPLEPKLDTSRFQRILIAGFVTGGTKDVDTNLETARLLRSQLRSSSKLEVIDTEVIELRDVAERQADFVPPRTESDEPQRLLPRTPTLTKPRTPTSSPKRIWRPTSTSSATRPIGDSSVRSTRAR